MIDNYNILVIDDVPEIIDLLKIYLKKENYGVFTALTGTDGLNILKTQEIHLVILDIMMPGMDGLETCRQIRQIMNIPIIMLSSKSQDTDKIIGLGVGADDYMVKPFNPMELVARVKSQLRRYLFLNSQNKPEHEENSINIKGLTINPKNHMVTIYGREVNLTPTEYEILFLLAVNKGTVFSTEEIFKRIWNEKYFEANNTVMVHIWRLREKIEENPKEPKIIETIWGVGYKIES